MISHNQLEGGNPDDRWTHCPTLPTSYRPLAQASPDLMAKMVTAEPGDPVEIVEVEVEVYQLHAEA